MLFRSPEMYNSIDSSTPSLSAGYDFDMDDYRKVVDVFSIEQGNTSGVNTLFTIEHTIAQQAYFGHLLGNVGYDLVTWHILKSWLDTREKVLALKPYLRFEPETQLLKIIPEPPQSNIYYGLIGCKVQKPIKFLVSELWVFRYVSALAKIAIANTRGKFSGTILFGGQQVNGADLMRMGEKEKDELEKELMEIKKNSHQISVIKNSEKRVWVIIDEVVLFQRFPIDLPEEQNMGPFNWIITGSAGIGSWVAKRHLEKLVYDLPIFTKAEDRKSTRLNSSHSSVSRMPSSA